MKLSPERVRALLQQGSIELLGLMPNASNYTFAASVSRGDLKAIAVYKPRDGETPLWDFPEGTLWQREIAACIVSDQLGWGIVPPTIERDGPHGIGSLQLYIDHDPVNHYLSLMPSFADTFRLVAAFDLVCNNADRKSGHCLLERDTQRIFVVDHGVCFSTEPKLRTVIWDFAGEPLPAEVIDDLKRLDVSALEPWLAPDEVDATERRARALVDLGSFPEPPADRRSYPWPPV